MYRRKDNRPDAPVIIYALKHKGVAVYIGQTCNVKARFRDHKTRYWMPKPITLEVLEETTAGRAIEAEREWIRRAAALGIKLLNDGAYHDHPANPRKRP